MIFFLFSLKFSNVNFYMLLYPFVEYIVYFLIEFPSVKNIIDCSLYCHLICSAIPCVSFQLAIESRGLICSRLDFCFT